jgi:hypothetical protein
MQLSLGMGCVQFDRSERSARSTWLARLSGPRCNGRLLPRTVWRCIWARHGCAVEAKPVFGWIHGGAFLGGAGNQYDGADLAKVGDMVVVTVN